MSNTERIRELNDAFRRNFIGGRILLTVGVDSLPPADKVAVLAKVQTFDAFEAGDDPYAEHDFIAIEHQGVRYFAKIDYYDPKMEFGSEAPDDPTRTLRVLTIMRADEY